MRRYRSSQDADRTRSGVLEVIRLVGLYIYRCGYANNGCSARDILYKYFGQLELLELRFAEVKVAFTWCVGLAY
jgi:hypothetical protein